MSDECLGTYITMEVISEERPTADEIQTDRYIKDVVYALKRQIPNFEENLSPMKFFYHTEAINFVDYIVLYLVINGTVKTIWDIGQDNRFFLHNRTVYVDKFVSIFYSEIHIYSLFIRFYNISNVEQTSSVRLPGLLNTNDTDLLYAVNSTLFNNTTCKDTQIVLLNKIRVCPYFKIHKTDFIFAKISGSLTIAQKPVAVKILLKLEPWEYMETDEYYLICIEDYLVIYVALSPPESDVGWLVVLRLNVPVNNFSVMSGRSHRFLGN